MNSFSEYMNGVKAEKELKEKTEAFVRTALSDAECQGKTVDSGSEFRKNRFAAKKLLVAAATLAACLVLVLGGNAYYHTPVNYVCLDINPSVELGINAFGRVVSTQAYNEDGLQLLEDIKYSNLSLKDAVSALIQEAADQGYIAEDGSTVIAVTAESNNEKTAAELQNTCEAEINLTLGAGETSAIVYTDCVNLQLRTQAREAGVSPGKFRLIEILQTLDSNITLEQYKNAKITDIITAASEIISENGGGQNSEYAGALEKIQNAAQQVQAAYGNTQQEQFQNQGSESGVQQQTQNQGSDSAAQEQEQNQNTDSNTQQAQGQGGSDQAQNDTSGGGQNQTGNQSGTGSVDNSSNSQSSTAPTETGSTANGNGSSSGSQAGSGKGKG
ncbi:hypothetical protein SDC9_51106 [bioreactor metagenome]|uniref:Anti-sigma factor RsgI-like middle domain-containing protein n=1 Tax=bioreactor metagenome TaxID=1076179 RepID=A0A644WLR6_9ZZZZ